MPILRLIHLFLLLLLSPISSLVRAQDFSPTEPHGGQAEFMRMVQEELVYPAAALQNEIEGTVTVFCIVEADGSTRDVRIFSGVNAEINAEALRVFNKVLWKPAIRNDVPTASEATLDVPFNTKRYKRWCKRRGYEQHQFPDGPPADANALYNYQQVEHPPEPVFETGIGHMRQFIAENIQYPKAAAKYSIEGVVTVQFVVEPNGNLSNVHPTKYLGGGCTEEVIRLLHLLEWQPGKQDGRTVRTLVDFTTTFALPESQGTHFGGGVTHTAFQ